MLSRRSFVRYVTLTTVSLPFLTGCDANTALKILVLNNSIPAQLSGKFRRTIPETSLKFLLETKLNSIYERLQTWQKNDPEAQVPFWRKLPFLGKSPAERAQLVTLGNYWFERAIAANLIQPIAADTVGGWQQLPASLQQYVKRNSQGDRDDAGAIWGAPYRFGNTVIAYNRKQFQKLGWFPQDWADLWHEDLKNRLSMVDQPREAIGLTLKKLGRSYNETNLAAIPNLKTELQQLHQQIKFYSSTHYLQPLILEDVWATIGWSHDILPLQQRYRDIEVIVPASGTATWLDLWVQPQGEMSEGDRAILQQWFDFCWQENPAWEISLWTEGLSPLLLTVKDSKIPEDLRNNAYVKSSIAAFPKSEIIEVLPDSVAKEYQQLWETLRQEKRG
ncbi:MAG: extracellular solute-binding protein [Jaaginema sp. PMC 1079.18]|nr:extracellular solute-binding protein [Jaaginema sp. PMC 1080.18]MEC4849962.1 extracellular solute-binding protein [Jaaginema sp. PMC 1079.18]MEC4866943.1 extracellular solute-binding protein [Jaaginema sp. PMC 1078.18]